MPFDRILLRSLWFNTPQLAAVTGGAGDLFPRIVEILGKYLSRRALLRKPKPA